MDFLEFQSDQNTHGEGKALKDQIKARARFTSSFSQEETLNRTQSVSIFTSNVDTRNNAADSRHTDAVAPVRNQKPAPVPNVVLCEQNEYGEASAARRCYCSNQNAAMRPVNQNRPQED